MSAAIVTPEPHVDMPDLPMADRSLGGRRIVVTRPQAQALGLSELIRAAGGVPVWFPTMEIEPLRDSADLDAALTQVPGYDLCVFVSSNAVACVWARLAALLPQGWPACPVVAATGPGTAAALAARGVARVIVPPAQFDSEGLVAELERLALQPRRVLILKGEGGREWLADTLRARGARVDCVASYRRLAGGADPAIIARLAQAGTLDGVVVASSEGGDQLIGMLGAQALEWLGNAPMFVPHPRIAERMRAHGVRQVVLTGGGDAGLIAGIAAHFAAAGTAQPS